MTFTMDSIEPSQQTVLDILDHWVHATPDADFLSVSGDAILSYKSAQHLVDQLISRRLYELCPGLHDWPPALPRMAVISRNSPLLPLTYLSLWRLSAVSIPFSHNADPSLWVPMAAHARIDMFLVSVSLYPTLTSAYTSAGAHKPRTIILESLVPGLAYQSNSPTSSEIISACNIWLATEDSLDLGPLSLELPHSNTHAATMFTSSAVDASGLKSVPYTHAMLLQAAKRMLSGMGGDEYLREPKRHLGWLPLGHAFELNAGLLSNVMGTGGTYVFFDPDVSSPGQSADLPLPRLLMSALAYHQPIHSMAAVPAIMASIVDDMTPDQLDLLRALHSLTVGGATGSTALFHWAREKGLRYYDMVGMTEAAGPICARSARSTIDGMTVFNVGLMGVLLKDDGEDEYGELVLIGKNLPRTYEFRSGKAFSYDEMTGVSTYRTGDLYTPGPSFVGEIFMADDPLPEFNERAPPLSDIHFFGRVDDILALSSGIKINAADAEHLLNSQPEIYQSAIILNKTGDTLVALIQPGPSASQATITDVVLRLNKALPFEKKIQRHNITFVESLPMTSKATLHRKKLKYILHQAGGQWPSVLPLTPEQHSPSGSGDLVPSNLSSLPEIPSDFRQRMENLVTDVLAVPLEEVQDPRFSLLDVHISSLASIRLASAIQCAFGRQLKRSDLFAARTIEDLCRLTFTDATNSSPPDPPSASPVPPRAATKLDHSTPSTSLVISGAACRFPNGIDNLDDYWTALLCPQSYVEHVAGPPPPSRWDAAAASTTLPMGWLDDASLDNVASFSAFFSLPQHEVVEMPPNIRLCMQMGYRALEDAGIAPRSLYGKPWGVFTSVNDSGWGQRRFSEMDLEDFGRSLAVITDDNAAGRLAYFLNLTGPAVEIKTACSSSAVAIHQACLSIKNGDCDGAIVIASATHFSAAGSIFRSKAGIASKTGRCATFSQDANGFLPSEGAAAIVIQRKDDASCQYYTEIRGTAVGQDGRSPNFFAPNASAQARVLQKALQNASCHPDDISYLEAHGTGTPVGDAIEVSALNKTFGGQRTRPLIVGAAKAVIGHTEECAGLAGILKAVLCFKHNIIPPQPHLGQINPELDLQPSRIVIPRKATAFSPAEKPRIIGVSSFGLSGTLSHIVLQEPEQIQAPVGSSDSKPHIFTLSSHTEASFALLLNQHHDYTLSPDAMEVPLADICRTSQLGRDHFTFRRAWVVTSWSDLHTSLASALTNPTPIRAKRRPKVALYFTLPYGQSVQRAHPINHPVYAQTLKACTAAGYNDNLVGFAHQLALTKALQSLGCVVSAVGGEGVAEYVAAAWAGVFELTALFSLLSALEPGEGVSRVVSCPRQTLDEHLMAYGPDEIRVVAQSGANATCLTGSPDALATLQASLASEARWTDCPLLNRSVPQDWHLRPQDSDPTSCIVSSHIGSALPPEVAASRNYWLGLPQREWDAGEAIGALAAQSDIVVALGASPLVEELADAGKVVQYDGDWLSVVARLYEVGCEVDWSAIGGEGPMAHLPVYCWDRDV